MVCVFSHRLLCDPGTWFGMAYFFSNQTINFSMLSIQLHIIELWPELPILVPGSIQRSAVYGIVPGVPFYQIESCAGKIKSWPKS